MNKPPTEPVSETRRRGVLVLQTLPILLIPIGTTLLVGLIFWLTNALPHPPGNRPDRDGGPLLPLVVLVVFFSALIMLVRLGGPTLSALLLIGVWTLGVTGAALQNGVTSNYPALLILPICAAGLLLDRAAAVSLAGLATLLVIGIGWLDMSGLGPTQHPPPREIVAFFENNRFYFATGYWIGIFWSIAALTALLAGGLQRALARSQADAAALQALSEQLEERVEQQTAKLLEQEREAATLEERARLARDIHDTIAQGLAGVTVQIGAAQRALEVEPSAAKEHMALAQSMARDSLAEARRSVWNLRAPALERGSLVDALRGLVERQTQIGLQANFAEQGQPQPLSATVEAALLRVTQEALANASRHAGASSVAVQLAFAPDAVTLTIKDDGTGFDPKEIAQPRMPGPLGGFGLPGMRERLAAIGGTLQTYNADGAVVEARVPVAG